MSKLGIILECFKARSRSDSADLGRRACHTPITHVRDKKAGIPRPIGPNPLPTLAPLRVALDWAPNVNHSGFYVALAKGLYSKHGLVDSDISIIPADVDGYLVTPARRVFAGQADFAVAPTETAVAYASPQAPGEAKAKLIAIAALLQDDTSAICVLEDSGIKSPKDLDGKLYASYGARYEIGIVRALIRRDGGQGTVSEYTPPKLGCFDEVTHRKADATWIFEARGAVCRKTRDPHAELPIARIQDSVWLLPTFAV